MSPAPSVDRRTKKFYFVSSYISHRVTAEEDCRFIIKSIQLSLPGLSQMPNVVLLQDWLNAQEIAALHSLGDYAHCAEGWGLGMSEAMAAGNLVVATGYSGNMEFMNEKNALLVDYQVEQVEAEDIRLQRTFQPDLSED